MKPVFKTKPQALNTLETLIVFIIIFFIAAVSLFFSIKFSDNNKNEFPELIYSDQLLPPKCSLNGGLYANTFPVTLTSVTPNTQIYYTLDGSEPTLKSTIYTGPIIIKDRTNEPNNLSNIPTSPRWAPPVGNVFKGTVLRAINISRNNKKSHELIRTFLVDKEGNDRYTFPIIALTINASDLFGHKEGIYVLGKNYEDKDDYIRKDIPLDLPWWEYPSNYLKRGSNAGRPVHVEFYEPNGALGFLSSAEIRINGNATRSFSQKSLRISFDKKYGISSLNYALFPGYPVTYYKSFILRNSGNDWNKTMFRDAFMQSLMVDFKLDVQQYRPAIVFFNGEYWGIHNIRERFDEHFIANKYKVNIDSIVILELDGTLFYGKKRDVAGFGTFLTYLKKNDLNQAINYEYVKKQIDVESFMDFVIANIYFCNSDWPNNNVKFWRYRSPQQGIDSLNYKDGRWRWMMHDTDWGFGYINTDAYQLNLFQKARETGSIGVIFTKLLTNKEFLDLFINRFKYHLVNTFNEYKVIEKIDHFQYSLAPEMEEHINRWRAIESYKKWEAYIDVLKDFARKRNYIQLQQLDEFEKKIRNEMF
ncbi:MAG: CotH kinase family protein [Bacteroidota bacterium]